ncbi:hypothetical protein Patl1_02762 [Pistacia atlantica]|uniref:Uncharacterized protein n=1 Tax=Pistacia atlantica TaxID=434234 RepID=A0ACC1C6F9_9ROSI|nr:hypothetical protein Patl1_02762 [Pistacia atlantica]
MFKITAISLPILSTLPFLFLFLFLSHADSSQLYDEEHAVLIKLKQPPPITHWTPSNPSHCTWPEITCTRYSITRLYLNITSITEIIPSFISDLKNLTLPDLHYNYIHGQFPRVLLNCSKLPDDIDSLSRLRYFSLGSSNFAFDISASVWYLMELREINLYQNQFNGSFPPEIGNLHNLEILGLAYNTKFLPSRLPSNFTQLKELRTLWMVEVNLIGEIP